jgi:hypothetical protein
MHTLKPGVSSTFSCAAGGTPFSVTGAAGASDIGGTNWRVLEGELDEPVSSCQTWGLRKKRIAASKTRILISDKTPLYYVAMTALTLFGPHLTTISTVEYVSLTLSQPQSICLWRSCAMAVAAADSARQTVDGREIRNYRASVDKWLISLASSSSASRSRLCHARFWPRLRFCMRPLSCATSSPWLPSP